MSQRLSILGKVVAATFVVFAMGNGEGHGCCAGEDSVLGPATETVCPPASTLTYANFGQAFMGAYCTRCHSSTLTGGARMGAPEFHDFDSQFGVQAVADHIDQAAGAGPAATNTAMPLNAPQPSLAERQQLAEWIACGAL